MSVGAVGVQWTTSPAKLAGSVEEHWANVERRLERNLRAAAELIRGYAVASHPWTNRTGEAEARLWVKVTRHGDGIALELGHGARHGVHLETRWAGKWGVIPKALTYGYPLAMSAAMDALRG